MNENITAETSVASLDGRQMHFAKAYLLSFGVFCFGLVVDQAARWTDHLAGIVNGLFQCIYMGIAWCLYLLPWSLLVFGLYRWRKWKRFRTHWMVAPSAAFFVLVLVILLIEPPTAANRFRSIAKVELPSTAIDLHYSLSGGGLADYGDQYYFKCRPEDVSKLIEVMKLAEDQSYKGPGSYSIISGLPGCPDPDSWTGSKQFRRDTETWFYYLLTNHNKTEVYVFIGCI
ncbi:hypothetical protein [Prosthecobacter sp.]|jgi:hypothetical protein|uniref:hypothetical protein n=1 Tax=Prosthecobacter sp. TaxID=1965333 RepID=UPI003783308D